MSTPEERCLPRDVAALVTRYLELADEALPGRIEGLYLVGSVALDGYRAGQSDVDFVAVTERALAAEELDRLETVHPTLLAEIGRPWFDGFYVTWADLARNPDDVADAPHTHEGRFTRERSFEVNPVTWLLLATRAVAIRGGRPEAWHDVAHLRTWTLNNLNTYWADTAARVATAGARLPEEAIPEAVVWCVAGVLRLAYTLATGDITSKSGACCWALSAYPERLHPVIEDALAIRGGERTHPLSPSPLEDTAALLRYVIESENARCR